jgi:DME family drug/metabolite transporter
MPAAATRELTNAVAPGRRAAVAGKTAVAAVLWGSVGPLVAVYPHEASGGFAVVRLVIGAAVLAVLALRSASPAGFSRHDRPTIVVGGLSVVAFQLLYFAVVRRAGVAAATFIAIDLPPVVTGVAMWLRHGVGPARRWWAASTTAIAGLALLVWGTGSEHHGTSAIGVLLAALACVSYSFQALTIDRLATSHGESRAVGAIFVVGTLMLVPSAAFASWTWVGQPMLLLGGLYAGIATLAAAYWLFAKGVYELGPSTAVLISLVEPVAAAALAILIVGELIDALQIRGSTAHLGRPGVVGNRKDLQPHVRRICDRSVPDAET